MSSEFETATIYVDLDSLFDTRLATIAQHFGMDAVKTVIANGYYGRIYDEFEGIDTEAFKAAYAKRDTGTLKQAMITPVVEMINLFAKQTLEALVSSPFRRQPKVVLNTYPYIIPPEVEVQLIIGLRAATKNRLDIEVVHAHLESLTPTYVKNNFIQMIMYSYWEWLDVHAANRNFVEVQCPNVALIGPAIMKSKEAAKQLQGTDAFEAVENYASLFIKLALYPVNIYSVDMARLTNLGKENA